MFRFLYRKRRFLPLAALCGFILFHHGGPIPASLGVCSMTEYVEGDGRAQYYFGDADHFYDQDLYCAAWRISRKERLTVGELLRVKDKINKRGREDITLLTFASLTYYENVEAIDQLLGAGADPTMPLMLTGPNSYANFIGEAVEGSTPFATQLVALYLKHGGDPNLKTPDDATSLASDAALMRNFEIFRLLVDYGADVWAPQGSVNPLKAEADPIKAEQDRIYRADNSAIIMAARRGPENNDHDFANLYYAIDHGGLKKATQEQIQNLISWVSFYELRDDAPSRRIVKAVRRIVTETNYPGDKRSREVLAYGDENGW